MGGGKGKILKKIINFEHFVPLLFVLLNTTHIGGNGGERFWQDKFPLFPPL